MIDSLGSLNKLNSEKLPVKIAFRVAQVSRQLDDHMKDYHKTLTKMHNELGKRDEAGELVSVVTNGQKIIQFEDPEVFAKAYEELLGCKVEVNGSVVKLDHFSSVKLEPTIFYFLDWFIKE